MIAYCSTFGRMAKDSEIKFRCDVDLRVRFERIAALERRNPADLGRIVFEDYVAAQERQLGLAGNASQESPMVRRVSSTSQAVAPEDISHKFSAIVSGAEDRESPPRSTRSAPATRHPAKVPARARALRGKKLKSPLPAPVKNGLSI